MKIHYAGGLRINRKDGYTEMLRGWASCVSGDAAHKIRNVGHQTMIASLVTCKRCLNNIKAAYESNGGQS